MTRQFRNIISLFLSIGFACLISACSNSDEVAYANYAEITTNSEEYWNTKVDYLPLDDSEYSYAGIPRIVIETANHQEIKDRETEIPAKLQIWGEKAPESEVMDLTIKGRGNTTWEYSKKPYAIKFEKKQSFLGMPEAKKWVMLANYRDRTLIRNAVAFELARQTSLAWTPHGKFVDVFLNGKFQGNYYICEKIEVKKNRLELDNNSFLLEFDTNPNNNTSFKTLYNDFPVSIKFPKEPNSIQINYIRDFINTTEKLLQLNADDSSYFAYVDQNSFIDYFIIYVLSTNSEPAHPKSVYMYKNHDGKLSAGPVWDFDYGTFKINKTGITNKNSTLFKQFFQKEPFRKKFKQRWLDLKESFFSIDTFIDSLSNYINDSNKQNIEIWPIQAKVNKIGDEEKKFDEAINMLKKAIHNKINEIDHFISTL